MQPDGSKVVYYTGGSSDLARISDFEFSGVDKIQLVGSSDNYFLSLGATSRFITDIFVRNSFLGSSELGGELIGQVVRPLSGESVDLSLSNPNQFVFV